MDEHVAVTTLDMNKGHYCLSVIVVKSVEGKTHWQKKRETRIRLVPIVRRKAADVMQYCQRNNFFFFLLFRMVVAGFWGTCNACGNFSLYMR